MGKAGERSCYQILPSTWKIYSKEILGYVAPLNEQNAEYVTVGMIQKWIDNGTITNDTEHPPKLWNQGNTGKCIKKAGVYDSCAYVQRYKQLFAKL